MISRAFASIDDPCRLESALPAEKTVSAQHLSTTQLTIVNERGIKIIKLADDVGEAKPGDSQTAAAEGKDGQTDVDMAAAEDADPAEAQRLRVQADMDKIKTLDLGKRREIAQLDMMGEYGSKVGEIAHGSVHH